MPLPMTTNNYNKLVDGLHEPYILFAQQSKKNVAFEVKEKLSKNKENLVDQVIDCDVSFDESWQKREYSSKNDIVSAISMDKF